MSDITCKRCGKEIEGGEKAVVVREDWPENILAQELDKYSGVWYHERHFPDIDSLADKPDINQDDWLFGFIIVTIIGIVFIPMLFYALGHPDISISSIYSYSVFLGTIALLFMVLYDGYRWVKWRLSV